MPDVSPELSPLLELLLKLDGGPVPHVLCPLSIDEPTDVGVFPALTFKIVVSLTSPRTGSQSVYLPTTKFTVRVAVFPLAISTVRLVGKPGPLMASACGNLPLFAATSVSGPGTRATGEVTLSFPSRSVT